MKIFIFRYSKLLIFVSAFILSCLIYLKSFVILLIDETEVKELTIRVNTYRRLDLLENFLKYYNSCDIVKSIQVVWSDQENIYPSNWINQFNLNKVEFEVHSYNSLTNRFKPLLNISTEAVLSIDDDLIVPCFELDASFNIWSSNVNTIVGFSPRIHTRQIENGSVVYNRWQHTWWNGIYSIMLTKVAIFHVKYLHLFKDKVSKKVSNYIDENRNCEDLAMAHIVSNECNCAPVWAKSIVYEVSEGGISSSSNHFVDRGKCLDFLRESFNSWPWVTGYQKSIGIGLFELISMRQYIS